MDIGEDILAKELGAMLLKYTKEINLTELAVRCDNACRLALNEIRMVVSDDTLTDFYAMEEIVCILERYGSDGGERHDFG